MGRTFRGALEQKSDALIAMPDPFFIGQRGEPSAVHLAIEVPHGPLVETLLERGFKVYAINPKQLGAFAITSPRPEQGR